MENDELKNFFEEQKNEIADNDFSGKVFRKLPAQNNKNWIVFLFAFIGLLVSIWLGLQSGLILKTFDYLVNIPFIYMMAALFCFPFITAPLFFLSKKIF